MREEPAIWLQTGTGRAFDLLQPTAAMVDFDIDVAEALARIPRFTGHVRSGSYSVAQHSVMGADALWRETGNRDLAAAFLLHDAHEAYLGDIATPVMRAIAIFCSAEVAQYELGPSYFRAAIRRLKHQIDKAVYQAAGSSIPADATAEAVALMDMRMLATERRHLLSHAPYPWQPAIEAAKPIRLIGKFRVWPWPEAADEYRARLAAYLPARPKSGPRRDGARRTRNLQEA